MNEKMFDDFIELLIKEKGKEESIKLLSETKEQMMDAMRVKQIKVLYKYLSFIDKIKFILYYPIILLPY